MSLSGMSARPLVSVVIFGFFCGLIVMCRPRPVGPTTEKSTLSPIFFASDTQDAASLIIVWIARRVVLSARTFYYGAVLYRGEVMTMNVRAVEAQDIDHLAQVWHESWNDAHGKIAPEGLVQARTLDSFRA